MEKKKVLVIGNLKDLTFEEIKLLAEANSRMAVTLTGELAVNGDDQIRASITAENREILNEIYDTTRALNGVIQTKLGVSYSTSDGEQQELKTKDGKEITKTSSKDQPKAQQPKEKKKLDPKEPENKEKKETAPEPIKTAVKPEEKKDERFKTVEELRTHLQKEIEKYTRENTGIIRDRKLPQDVKAAFKKLIFDLAPNNLDKKDPYYKLPMLGKNGKPVDSNLVGNFLSEITKAAFETVKGELQKDGNAVANNSTAAEELKKNLDKAELKKNIEGKVRSEQTQEEEKKEEETSVETPEKTPAEEPAKKEGEEKAPAKETSEEIPAEETPTEEKEEDKRTPEQKAQDVILSSTDKEELKSAISTLLTPIYKGEKDEKQRSIKVKQVVEDVSDILTSRVEEDNEIKKMLTTKDLGTKSKKSGKEITYSMNITRLLINPQIAEIKKAV